MANAIMFKLQSIHCLYLVVVCLYLLLSLGATDATSPTYQVVGNYSHDAACYTQGLVIHGGFIYESCGQYGRSTLRKYDKVTRNELLRYEFDKKVFVEGIVAIDGYILTLSWKERKMFLFDMETLTMLGKKIIRTYNRDEGWGIAKVNSNLIITDGSSHLNFFRIPDFKLMQHGHKRTRSKYQAKTLPYYRDLIVRDADTLREIPYLNELEYANGYLYANVYYEDRLLKINPLTGMGTWVDLTSLYPQVTRKLPRGDHVMNGIAYDSDHDTFLITGKYWPYAFELKLEPQESENDHVGEESKEENEASFADEL
jgi:glutaminyl-peptide cyclotransferase